MIDPSVLPHVDTLRFDTRMPFNFRYTFWKPSHFATKLETHSQAESWRTFRLGDVVSGVHAYQTGKSTVTAEVYADGQWTEASRDRLSRRLRWSYGLDEDLSAFIELCQGIPAMRGPFSRLMGMRQSCPEDLFEIAIISLLLQNATVVRTRQMMENLLGHYGRRVSFAGQRLSAFFAPEELAEVSEERFRLEDRLGYRAKYMGRFASFFAEHSAELEGATNDDLTAKFQEIKGVGPYTAAVIASHASRDPSALGLDVWNRKLLARHLMNTDDASPEAVRAVVTGMFPGYEGLAALYLIEYEYAENPVAPLMEAAATG